MSPAGLIGEKLPISRQPKQGQCRPSCAHGSFSAETHTTQDGSRTLVHRMVTVMNACQLLAVANLWV